MNTAKTQLKTFDDVMAHDGVGQTMADDNALRAQARAAGIDVDPEAYPFNSAAEVLPFLSGFFTRPLTAAEAQTLLRTAHGATGDAHALMGSAYLGCRTKGPVPLLALGSYNHTIYLRYHVHADGGIHVTGWGTSPSAVAALPDGAH